jgi:DNA-binding response OmpR family regulator
MFQLRLLVADGDREMTDRLRVWLATWGFDAHVANCGTEALKVAEYHRPHIAILNLTLPELDGLRVAQLLGRQTTRIAIADLPPVGDRPRSWEAEFHSFLVKPLDWNKLRLLLQVLEREHEYLESHGVTAAPGEAAPGHTLLAMQSDFVVQRGSVAPSAAAPPSR